MLEGYNLIRSDNPSNTNSGGVCIYYKESLAVCLVDITSLLECLVGEVKIQNVFIAAMYRSPSQSSIKFKSLLSGFKDMLSSVLCCSQNHNLLLF